MKSEIIYFLLITKPPEELDFISKLHWLMDRFGNSLSKEIIYSAFNEILKKFHYYDENHIHVKFTMNLEFSDKRFYN